MTVFLDANVPMYLVGSAHPNRDRTEEILDDLILGETRLVTDAEVFQEILHRYSAIHRPEAIDPAYETLLGIVDDVFPIALPEVDAARALVKNGTGARDAIHLAAMRNNNVTQILSFDRGFDHLADIQRLY